MIKISTIFKLIIIMFIGSILIVAFGKNIREERCYDECHRVDITCDNNDNNCVGGNHYCYDMCIGGVTRPVGYEIRELFESALPYFTISLLIGIILMMFMIKKRGKNG